MDNPNPLTQSHTQPPGAAAQPAEPGPNPAGRGAEPNVYIAHPTHGAGTRPSRTQPPTAARKTTLNAGQCVRQPREGRGRNRQTPPKENRGGGGGGERTAQSHQTARQHHKRRPNPPPRMHQRQDPQRGIRGPPSQNRQHKARNSGPPGEGTPKHAKHGNMEKKKTQQPSPKERGWGDRDHTARDRDSQAPTPQSQTKTRQKKKRKKNTPRQPNKEGRGTAETRAQHARPHTAPQPGKAGNKQGARTDTHPRTESPSQEVQETTWDGRTSTHTPQHPPKERRGAAETQTRARTPTPHTGTGNGGG